MGNWLTVCVLYTSEKKIGTLKIKSIYKWGMCLDLNSHQITLTAHSTQPFPHLATTVSSVLSLCIVAGNPHIDFSENYLSVNDPLCGTPHPLY